MSLGDVQNKNSDLELLDYIKGLKAETIDKYKRNYLEAIRDYNEEKELINGYNGRQLLELLQNCDDEGAIEVLIDLNTKNQQVSVSDNGASFSKDGYQSLFIPHLSSKTDKKKFIGNKGLGFRSIVKWCNSIEVHSNGIALVYDAENRKANFNDIFNETARKNIREKRNKKKDAIIIPFLTLPKLGKSNNADFSTKITVKYQKQYEKDILNQLEQITSETLLFLKNIQKVVISSDLDNSRVIECKRTSIDAEKFGPASKIDYSDYKWDIFTTEGPIPDEYLDSEDKEQEFYEISIAIEENFSRSSAYLYSFFPTRIKLNQPYVLHATFDLDSTRNQLTDTAKNQYILKKVVEFTIKVSKYFTKEHVNYKPLKILEHTYEADTLEGLGYYELVNKAIKEEELFPCIDNTYKKKAEVFYTTDDFAKILIDIKAQEYLNCHLIPSGSIGENFVRSFNCDKDLGHLQDFSGCINGISSLIESIELRVKFINELKELKPSKLKEEINSISLLLNNYNEKISGGEYVYTPVSKDQDLKVPSFTKIQFINGDLFNEFLKWNGFENSDVKDKGRFVANELNSIFNIHSYEPATLIGKIISETNKQIAAKPDKASEFIQEMCWCLFSNFQLMNDTTKLPASINVQLLSKSGKVKKANELILSGFYPKGKKTQLIFEGIYHDDDYVTSKDLLGLSNFDIVEIEGLLLWLGVNQFARFVRKEKVDCDTFDANISSLYKYQSEQLSILNHGKSNVRVTFTDLEKKDLIIPKLTVERLLLWCFSDSRLRSLLDDSNGDTIHYFFRSNRSFNCPLSYMKFYVQKIHEFKFQYYLIEDQFKWTNDNPIDYNYSQFHRYTISKTEINSILLKLGAKELFEDLDSERVFEILEEFPSKFPDGKRSQTLYKRALRHYQGQNEDERFEIDPQIHDIRLFAHTSTELLSFEPQEIYFSEKIKLPKRLYDDFPILNFPARAGGAEAIKFFNINDLKILKTRITNYSLVKVLSNEMKTLLDQIKPILLLYRINDIEELKQRKLVANVCNNIQILLCDTLEFEVSEKTYALSNYEFINKEKITYFIKVVEFTSLSKLRRNPHFIDSFSSCIAQIFDVPGQKADFKETLRMEFQDLEKNVLEDYGKELYEDARSLLGLSSPKQNFWEAIFNAKGFSYETQLDDLQLEDLIEERFGYPVDINSFDYSNSESDSFIKDLKSLFDRIGLTISDFNEYSGREINLSNYHKKNLEANILGRKEIVKQTVWMRLSKKSIDEKKLFLEIINSIENCEDFIAETTANNCYEFNLDYEKISINFIESRIGYTLLTETVELDAIKTKNESKFNEYELQVIHESTDLKSLTYFENCVSYIKEYFKKGFHTGDADEKSNDQSQLKNKDQLQSDTKFEEKKANPGIPLKTKSKGNKGVYLPSQSLSRNKKEKGDSNEKLVYEEMIRMGLKEVQWVSKDNEGLHHDLRYVDEDGFVKYVEVKSFDDNYFYVSKDEFMFGREKGNSYEIWLVKEKSNITKIQNVFCDPEFEESITPNEYKVYPKID